MELEREHIWWMAALTFAFFCLVGMVAFLYHEDGQTERACNHSVLELARKRERDLQEISLRASQLENRIRANAEALENLRHAIKDADRRCLRSK